MNRDLTPNGLPSKYVPQTPTEKQRAFLVTDHVRELFFGGSAGPGKSSALLMAALQYVHVPGYAALILRRNYTQLSQPGALMSRAHEWLAMTDAHWNGTDKTWTFPSGAKLMFGHLNHEADALNYQSSEFQFIGFDELTGFTETMYRFLFSRLRRTTILKQAGVPLRMRSASNPGGNGHQWVRARFVDPATREPAARFIPARLEDMPHLDQAAYIESLQLTYPVTWKRLLYGDWDVAEAGTIFHAREWLADRTLAPDHEWANIPPGNPACRIWDLAATEPNGSNPDPDWTAGVKCSYNRRQKRFVIHHAYRLRKTAGTRDKEIGAIIRADGRGVLIGVEQEKAAAGKSQAEYFERDLKPKGWRFHAFPPSGEKAVRAWPLSAFMEQGFSGDLPEGAGVFMVEGEWNEWLLDEYDSFTGLGETHDDGVDSSSYGFTHLVLNGGIASQAGAQIAAQQVAQPGLGRQPTGRRAGTRGGGVSGHTLSPRR